MDSPNYAMGNQILMGIPKNFSKGNQTPKGNRKSFSKDIRILMDNQMSFLKDIQIQRDNQNCFSMDNRMSFLIQMGIPNFLKDNLQSYKDNLTNHWMDNWSSKDNQSYLDNQTIWLGFRSLVDLRRMNWNFWKNQS